MYDLSIIVPSIRTPNWAQFINSVKQSCIKHTWEIIFIGPFKDESLLINNIKHIENYSTVPVCLQIASIQAQGKLLHHNVDDSIFYENSLDTCIDFYNKNCSYKDLINGRYREGKNHSGYEFNPNIYWRAGTYPTIYCKKYVNPNWLLSLQPLLNREYFIELGGLNTNFEYSNHSHIDFSFRLLNNGGNIFHSPVEIVSSDHSQIDHQPIEDAQNNDQKLFDNIWNNEQNRIYIDINNYKDNENIWIRRFDKKYSSYKELIEKYEIPS